MRPWSERFTGHPNGEEGSAMSLERRYVDILTMGRSGIDIFLSKLTPTSKTSRPSESSSAVARRKSQSPPHASGIAPASSPARGTPSEARSSTASSKGGTSSARSVTPRPREPTCARTSNARRRCPPTSSCTPSSRRGSSRNPPGSPQSRPPFQPAAPMPNFQETTMNLPDMYVPAGSSGHGNFTVDIDP